MKCLENKDADEDEKSSFEGVGDRDRDGRDKGHERVDRHRLGEENRGLYVHIW